MTAVTLISSRTSTYRESKALDAYFGLKEGLEALLGRHVDLVMPSALRNPYFRNPAPGPC